MPNTHDAQPTMNIGTFPFPRSWSHPPTPASASMKRSSKNWQPVSRRRGSWNHCWCVELEESKYEVVIGARRLRAAKLAELESVPVRVKQAHRCRGHRGPGGRKPATRGHPPLEESLGFKSLLELGEPTYTIASIAARAGKSEAYVYGRIKLADLIPPVAEAF
jgi:ParB-like chromosome segregation protein Spo0J